MTDHRLTRWPCLTETGQPWKQARGHDRSDPLFRRFTIELSDLLNEACADGHIEAWDAALHTCGLHNRLHLGNRNDNRRQSRVDRGRDAGFVGDIDTLEGGIAPQFPGVVAAMDRSTIAHNH
jgi:hypothetical protein